MELDRSEIECKRIKKEKWNCKEWYKFVNKFKIFWGIVENKGYVEWIENIE